MYLTDVSNVGFILKHFGDIFDVYKVQLDHAKAERQSKMPFPLLQPTPYI